MTEGTEEKNTKKRKNLPAWIQALCAVALVVITFFYTRYAYRQVEEMQRAIKTNQEASKVAKDALDSQKSSTERILTEMKAQSKAMESQAKSSNMVALVAQESLHLAEAADIQIEQIDLSSTGGKPLSPETRIRIVYRNYGRTRAEEVKNRVSFGVPNTDVTLAKIHKIEPLVYSTASLAGGQTLVYFLTVGDTLNKEAIALINDGALVIHLWGAISYKDIFKKRLHGIEFDSIYDPKMYAFAIIKNNQTEGLDAWERDF